MQSSYNIENKNSKIKTKIDMKTKSEGNKMKRERVA